MTTAEQVDLWLHGFVMLTSDTGRVPFFARGYKQQVTALKQQRNVYSLLDANRAELSSRFATNPALANAQFLAMYFSSFPEIVSATDYFIRSGGNPRAAADPNIQQQIALLAANFRTDADRKWLRLFVQSLDDENKKFYHDYWTSEQQTRGAAFAQAVQQWNNTWYPKLARFLNNTQQASGEVFLSLPLGGEGRTVNNGKQSNIVAVEFPRTVETAPDVLFAFAHEAVANVVDGVIRDNTTPARATLGRHVRLRRQRRRARRCAPAATRRSRAGPRVHALLPGHRRTGGHRRRPGDDIREYLPAPAGDPRRDWSSDRRRARRHLSDGYAR